MEDGGRKLKANWWKTSKHLWRLVEEKPKVDCKNALEEKTFWWEFQEEKQKVRRIKSQVIGDGFYQGLIQSQKQDKN